MREKFAVVSALFIPLGFLGGLSSGLGTALGSAALWTGVFLLVRPRRGGMEARYPSNPLAIADQVAVTHEAMVASVYMTFIQALDAARESFASEEASEIAEHVPGSASVFSGIASRALRDGAISQFTFDMLQFSRYNVIIRTEDSQRLAVMESDHTTNEAQRSTLNSVFVMAMLAPGPVTRDSFDSLFSDLVNACSNLGLDRDDDENVGLLFVVTVFFTTVLKDSQQDAVYGASRRSIGKDLAIEMVSKWLSRRVPT